MKRKSLKGMLSRRISASSDKLELTDTELLLSAANSLINSLDTIHDKLSQAEQIFRLRERLSAIRIIAHSKCVAEGYDNRMLIVKWCEDALQLPPEQRFIPEPK